MTNPAFPQPPQNTFQFPTNAAPATGQLNAQLDQQFGGQQQQQQPPAVNPTPADYGTAAFKLLNGIPFGPSDSPAVHAAGAWVYANGSRAQEMLAHYVPPTPHATVPTINPATGQPGQPLNVQPGTPTVLSTSPPGWNPQPGAPNMLHAAQGNVIPPDAPPANTALVVPEEKKKRASKAAATGEMATVQIVLLGRVADAADELVAVGGRLATAFERIAAALERPRQ